MESYVIYMQGLYAALLSNIAEQIPAIRRDCERDSSRLLSLIDARGLPFVMIELPAVGKHFDQCLADGRLTRSFMAGQRLWKKGRPIPRLFKGLILRVFDESGVLRSNPDIASIRHLRQLYYMAKKMEVACDDSKTWEQVHEFFETDRNVRQSSLDWEADSIRADSYRDLHFGDPSTAGPVLLFGDDRPGYTDVEESIPNCDYGAYDTLQRVCDIVSATLGSFEPAEWGFRHGPGAVADQSRSQSKYGFPTWSAKLGSVFPAEEYGVPNYLAWVEHLDGYGCYKDSFSLHEPPSRLIAVPKTLKGPRLIAAEPTSHQWCQQSLLDYFTHRLRKTPISRSIDFKDQSKNGKLALSASHTSEYMTIDLSSASDRLSCWVVERVFRANNSLLNALHASRTRWVSNTIDKKSPRFHKLRKFSCMGSACTFPVQSITFTCMAIASILIQDRKPVTIRSVRHAARRVQVFGDDIIVPVDCREVLLGLLGNLGLKVNYTKTFWTGKFRESCGIDAYDGHDVTPAYIKAYPDVSRPESIVAVVSTHNNFFMKGYEYVCKRLKSTEARVSPFWGVPSVPVGSGTFGFHAYEGFIPGEARMRSRWNKDLHERQFRVRALRNVEQTRNVPGSNQTLLQYFTEARRRNLSKKGVDSNRPFIRGGSYLGLEFDRQLNLGWRWVSERFLRE